MSEPLRKQQGPEVDALVERIRPLLAGHDSGVQGVALADLMSMWLAGHQILGDVEATETARAELLMHWCGLVTRLTAINAAVLGTDGR